jgi:hypothetical protein
VIGPGYGAPGPITLSFFLYLILEVTLFFGASLHSLNRQLYSLVQVFILEVTLFFGACPHSLNRQLYSLVQVSD